MSIRQATKEDIPLMKSIVPDPQLDFFPWEILLKDNAEHVFVDNINNIVCRITANPRLKDLTLMWLSSVNATDQQLLDVLIVTLRSVVSRWPVDWIVHAEISGTTDKGLSLCLLWQNYLKKGNRKPLVVFNTDHDLWRISWDVNNIARIV